MSLALAAALLPVPAAVVERWYSNGLYLSIQRALTSASNAVPFALLDVLVAAALGWLVWTGVRAVGRTRRERSVGVLGAWLVRTVAATAGVYLVFMLCWGFNYQRVPVAQRLVATPAPPTLASVSALGVQAVGRLNALYGRGTGDSSHEPWRDPGLRTGFSAVQRLLGGPGTAVPGRLKHSLGGRYFRWAGVDGMVNPFALETIANPDLIPAERPFVAAHEWGHLAGYADESEASFVGWLTCLHAGDAAQYSGWLFLYWQIASEVDAETRRRLFAALESGPRSDVDAIVARLRRGEVPVLRAASWRVYDQYLKANRVEEGVRSYSAVVSLILRTSFTDGWTPRLRGR